MRGVVLAPELQELRSAAERLARSELAPHVREAEAAGRWPSSVLDVLDGFPLGGLDLPEALGGVGAGLLAKVVVLETLAAADAGGLPGADRPGIAVGAVVACPDRGLAGEVAASCLDGSAQCGFTVIDAEHGAPALEWAPGWPALRWVWAMDGDTLRLHELTGPAETVSVLAFHASGGVAVRFSATNLRGTWGLSPWVALDVRGRARLWAAAVAVGIATAALTETISYTTERVVFGKPVAHHQGNAFELAHAAARVHGARLAVRDAASSFDRGEPDAAFWATQAWLETMEAAHNATNLGIQLLGGHGFIVDHLAEKRFREARMLAMLAGARDAAEFDVASFVLEVEDPLGGTWAATVIELDARTQEMLEEVRALGRTYIRPMGLEADRTATPPPVDHEFYLICTRQGGIVSRLIGAEEGATALDWKPLRNFLVGEETAYWDRGVALSLPGPGLGGSALRNTGTPEQRERFLQIFTDHSRARWGAMAMTEPGAGSDVARIQTRARKDGREWVLTGQKMFCSNSARADWVVVWATVDPALGRDGHRAFVVERGTAGFEILKIEHKMGSRGYETASFALDDVRVPEENLLGGESFYESRRGFKASMATFNMTRPMHTAHGVGMGRAAHDFALDFVRTDYPAQGRRRQRALERLARIRRGLHVARLMYLDAVSRAKRGESNVLEASYAKMYSPPVVLEAVATALDILGEAGVRNDRMLEKLYRDVKILDIGEGTQQVQRVIVARQLLGLPRDD